MNPDWSSGSFFQPGNLKSIPSFKGIDFSTGKTVDLAKFLAPSPQRETPKEESALPDIDPRFKSYLELFKATSPQRLAEMEAAANISANLSERQLRQLYPYLSAAGAESTARNLAASQAYRAFTEQLPSNVQNIMASKQQQMASAALGEAELQRATAAQQQAASQYPGRFAGQYVSFG